MKGLNTAKRATFAASTIIWVFVGFVVAGPLAGVLTQQFNSEYVVGLNVDLSQASPQLNSIFQDGSTLVGSHVVHIPVRNNWVFPASAGISLKIISSGSVLYQTPTSSIRLAPFRTGQLNITLSFTSSLVRQLEGKRLVIGGNLNLGSPSELLNFTVTFPRS
jgi:hypothetical protein